MDAKTDKFTERSKCIISLSTRSLEAVSLIPRILTSLEHTWGIEEGSFIFDSFDNKFQLQAHYHRSFQANEWMLVPMPDMLNNLHKRYLNGPGMGAGMTHTHAWPNIHDVYAGAQSFSYLLVTTGRKAIRDAPIARYSASRVEGERRSLFIFNHPYKRLGLLPTHVPPHYVIINYGLKYQTLLAKDPRMHMHLQKRYQNIAVANGSSEYDAETAWTKMMDIFFAWTEAKCCGGVANVPSKTVPPWSASLTSQTDEEDILSETRVRPSGELQAEAHRWPIGHYVTTWCQDIRMEEAMEGFVGTLPMDEAMEWENTSEACRSVHIGELSHSEPEFYLPEHLVQLAHRRINFAEMTEGVLT